MELGDKFKTQDGRDAYIIAIDTNLSRPLVFRVDDQVWTRQLDGKHCDKCDGSVYPAVLIGNEDVCGK